MSNNVYDAKADGRETKTEEIQVYSTRKPMDDDDHRFIYRRIIYTEVINSVRGEGGIKE